MKAYVSGEARRAVVVQEGRYLALSDSIPEQRPIALQQLSHYFLHARDVEEVEVRDIAALWEIVQVRSRRDHALRFAISALDVELAAQLREACARRCEALMQDDSVALFVKHRLNSRPFPSELQVEEVSSFLQQLDVPVLERTFDLAALRQEAITACSAAWDELPDEIFQGDDREMIRERVVQAGAFYDFVAKETDPNQAIFNLMVDPVLKGRAYTRSIFTGWASKYKESPRRYVLEQAEFDISEDDALNLEPRSNFEIYSRVKKQVGEIKRAMYENDMTRRDDLVEQLIRYQRNGDVAYLSKSLCTLGSYAKELGDLEQARELTCRAVAEVPSDARAHSQLGNIELALNDLQSARRSFESARQHGDERAALVGLAEVMRHVGQRELALQTIEECVAKYPGDILARNLRASLFAHFGLLDRALEAYDAIIEDELPDRVSYAGRAGVNHDLGRRVQALGDMEISVSLAGDDPIPSIAMADMKRELGDFAGALEAVADSPTAAKWRMQFALARSRILRDMGDANGAAEILRILAKQFPRNPFIRTALAEIFRRTGDFESALAHYSTVESSAGSVVSYRVAMACTFAAMSRFDEALAYLPDREVATRSEWAGLHVRGMIELRRGNPREASVLFQRGLTECPWIQQRPYFASGCAISSLRLKRSDLAVDVLRSVRTEGSDFAASGFQLVAAHAEAATDGKLVDLGPFLESNSLLEKIALRVLSGEAANEEAIFEIEEQFFLAAIA